MSAEDMRQLGHHLIVSKKNPDWNPVLRLSSFSENVLRYISRPGSKLNHEGPLKPLLRYFTAKCDVGDTIYEGYDVNIIGMSRIIDGMAVTFDSSNAVDQTSSMTIKNMLDDASRALDATELRKIFRHYSSRSDFSASFDQQTKSNGDLICSSKSIDQACCPTFGTPALNIGDLISDIEKRQHFMDNTLLDYNDYFIEKKSVVKIPKPLSDEGKTILSHLPAAQSLAIKYNLKNERMIAEEAADRTIPQTTEGSTIKGHPWSQFRVMSSKLVSEVEADQNLIYAFVENPKPNSNTTKIVLADAHLLKFDMLSVSHIYLTKLNNDNKFSDVLKSVNADNWQRYKQDCQESYLRRDPVALMLSSNIFIWFLQRVVPRTRQNAIFHPDTGFTKSNPFKYRVNLIDLIRAGLTPVEIERYGNQLESFIAERYIFHFDYRSICWVLESVSLALDIPFVRYQQQVTNYILSMVQLIGESPIMFIERLQLMIRVSTGFSIRMEDVSLSRTQQLLYYRVLFEGINNPEHVRKHVDANYLCRINESDSQITVLFFDSCRKITSFINRSKYSKNSMVERVENHGNNLRLRNKTKYTNATSLDNQGNSGEEEYSNANDNYGKNGVSVRFKNSSNYCDYCGKAKHSFVSCPQLVEKIMLENISLLRSIHEDPDLLQELRARNSNARFTGEKMVNSIFDCPIEDTNDEIKYRSLGKTHKLNHHTEQDNLFEMDF